MWYYDKNGNPFGPVSLETLSDEVKSGTIDASTRVWREGMLEWKRLDESALAGLVGLTPPEESESIENKPQPVQLDPQALKTLFWCWFVFLLIDVPFTALSQLFPDQPWVSSLFCFSALPSLAAMVLQFILLFRFWQLVQDGRAKASPLKAVGFLFIPFFNYYWNFVAYYGLARELNRVADLRMSRVAGVKVRKTHPFLSLTYATLAFVNLFYSVVNGIWLLTNSSTSFGEFGLFPQIPLVARLPAILFYIANIALVAGTLWEFHQTSQDLLAVQEK